MANVYEETLANWQEMRKAISFRFRWYYHVTPAVNVNSIREKGLLTNPDKYADSVVREHMGEDGSKIICLNPLGAKVVPPAVQEPPYIVLAVDIQGLPHRIGLDWSHDGAVGCAQSIHEYEPQRLLTDVFIEAVYRFGSMVVYDGIARQHLRVCCKGCLPHDPGRWPLLVNVPNDQIIHFGSESD